MSATTLPSASEVEAEVVVAVAGEVVEDLAEVVGRDPAAVREVELGRVVGFPVVEGTRRSAVRHRLVIQAVVVVDDRRCRVLDRVQERHRGRMAEAEILALEIDRRETQVLDPAAVRARESEPESDRALRRCHRIGPASDPEKELETGRVLAQDRAPASVIVPVSARVSAIVPVRVWTADPVLEKDQRDCRAFRDSATQARGVVCQIKERAFRMASRIARRRSKGDEATSAIA